MNLDFMYYLSTDHLGSINLIVDASNGNVVDDLSYDAWGNKRNPSNWSLADTRTTWITTRGFTGHEHLDKFGLINANARMYEPLTGKFLAPDPFVQAPNYSQSFNRYAYCFNNPLKYTDPSGEYLGTMFTFGIDLASTIFTKGGLEFWNWNGGDSYVGKAWENFDPSAKWSKTNKAARIDLGLLNTDPNKNLGERAWELTSRFTWQLPQTLIGNAYAHLTNSIYNKVKSVNYFGGTTIIDVDELVWGRMANGVTLGNYILGVNISSNPFEIDPRSGRPSDGAMLIRHEYGHYIQSQVCGPLYIGKYGIPSANGNAFTWTEVDAEYRSDQYFIKHYDNDSRRLQYGKGRNSVNPVDFLFITQDSDRYSKDYRPINPRWSEYGLFIPTGFFMGTLLIGLFLN